MAHRPRKDCNVPGNAASPWRCPACGTVWDFDPNAGAGADIWHGNDNVRTASGAKPKTTLWGWLTS